VDDAFDAAGVTRLNAHHLRTVFETNVMSAYSAANWDMLHHPVIADEFPLFQFEGVDDDRQSEFCRPIDGIVLPRDHGFWRTHWPPLHPNCRSRVRPIHRDDAARMKITPNKDVPFVEHVEGFGYAGGAKAHWNAAERLAGNEIPKSAELDIFGKREPKIVELKARDVSRKVVASAPLPEKDVRAAAKALRPHLEMPPEIVRVAGFQPSDKPGSIIGGFVDQNRHGTVFLLNPAGRVELYRQAIAEMKPVIEDALLGQVLRVPSNMNRLTDLRQAIAHTIAHEQGHRLVWGWEDAGEIAEYSAVLKSLGLPSSGSGFRQIAAEDVRLTVLGGYLNRVTLERDVLRENRSGVVARTDAIRKLLRRKV
jgi:hypothetical protein